MDNLYIRTDKQDERQNLVNEVQLRRALTGNYEDIGICIEALERGEEIDTPFAIYSKMKNDPQFIL